MVFLFIISVFWSPFFEHVLEAWEKRSHPNMLFLFYEDMIRVGIEHLQYIHNYLPIYSIYIFCTQLKTNLCYVLFI